MNDVAILADIMIMKSLDKDGNKVFKFEDKITLCTNQTLMSDKDCKKMVRAPT